MAMLLILCIGAASLLMIQLRVAQATIAHAKARLNAMAGARIALGEIQRQLGPDQRVSATADILCDPVAGTTPKDIAFYKSSANNTGPGASGTVVHPRWTGVWNSGRIEDGTIATAPVSGDETKVIQRDAQNGYLQDARFADGKDWAKSRVNPTLTKRFAGWLVSGNEATTPDKETTPFSPIHNDDKVLVGAELLGNLFNPGEKRSDMMGVRAPAVSLPDSVSGRAGAYSYWVADEGVKARVNLTDPYEVAGKAPDGNGGAGYFRLMVPQRNNLAGIQDPVGGASTRWENYGAKAKTGAWANCTRFADLVLTDPSVQPADGAPGTTVAANYLHDLTFDAASVLADVVNGGLRRDLTPFLDSGDIAAVGSTTAEIIQPTKLTATTPILNDAGLSIFDKNGPLLAHLRSWNNVAPQSFTGTINPQTPSGYFQPANAVFPLPDYTTQGAASAVAVSPVLAAVDMYYSAAYDPNDTSTPSEKFKFLFYPRIVLWNPYDVPINISGMELYWARKLFGGGINGIISGIGKTIKYSVNTKNTPFHFVFPSMTLKPGESVGFRCGEPGKKLQEGKKIQLVAGSMLAPAHCYVWGAASPQPTLTPDQELLITNGSCNINLNNAYNYIAYGTGPHAHVYLLQSGTVIQQIDSEEFSYPNIAPIFNTVSRNFRVLSEETGRFPHPTSALKYRLIWIDDKPSRDDSTGGTRWDRISSNNYPTWRKNIEMNLMLEFNARCTRFTRFPCDMMRQFSDDFRPYNGFFTNDCNSTASFGDGPYLAQGTGSYVSPLFRNNKGDTANTRYTIYSVPRKETGILSLAALQSAPLIPFAWSTSMPIGNSYPDVAVPTDRSALGIADEKGAWILPFCAGSGPFASSVKPSVRIGTNLTQVDWSYELNNALWDGFFFSGIEKSNGGWDDESWEKNTAVIGKRFRNARLQQVRKADDDTTNNAIRAASTCLLKGGFNVNSTSVAAWASLLSAFRDIPVATKSNGVQNSAGATPYLRNLWPDKGPLTATQNATFDEKTWSGYRTLSDDEIAKLAAAIVKEVRTRGPFLSLADFVNRRLKPNPYDSYAFAAAAAGYFTSLEIVKKWEADYHGTIQAAIDNTAINDRFDQKGLGDDYFVNMKRNFNADGIKSYALAAGKRIGAARGGENEKYGSMIPRIEHLPRHKAAGAPAYLTQADVLQQIGSVLSARSDTFKIRCKGVSDEGAEATVEMIVQRTTDALIPRRDNGKVLAHVPEGVTTGPLVGTQHFGRRFVVNSFRYVGENEI